MRVRRKYLMPFEDVMNIFRRLDRTMYMIAAENDVMDPKCGYCDSERMITLKGENGQTARVPCRCGEKRHKVYYVIPCRVLSLRMNETQIELRYSFRNREYSRRHDSLIDPVQGDKRIQNTNYISMSFTTKEKAEEYIRAQGWIYDEKRTEAVFAEAERGMKSEIKEKIRPAVPDEKLEKAFKEAGAIADPASEGD